MTSLPTPEQWGLAHMNEMEVAEMIEKYIDFVDKDGRSVHLPMPFVRHYMRRDDGALPTVATVATLPIVLADGVLLAPDGLDRLRGIWFEIQKEVRAVIPEPERLHRRGGPQGDEIPDATNGCAMSIRITPVSARSSPPP